MDRYTVENQFFFEEAIGPVCVLDENGRILKLNSAYSDFFGFENSQLLNQPFTIHFTNLAEEEKEILLEEYKFLNKHNQPFIKNFRVFDKQENPKDVEFINKILISHDEIITSILFIREIPVQDKIQATLAHLNLLPISFSKIKVNTQTGFMDYHFLSDNFQDDFGISTKEIQKNPRLLEKSIHPNDILNFRSVFLPNFNKLVNSVQYRIQTPPKTVKWVETKYFQEKLNESEFLLYSMSYEIKKDLHDKKIFQDKIRKILFEKNEAYKLLFDNTPIGILLIDKRDKMIVANEYMENYLDVSRKNYFRKNFEAYIANDSLEAYKNYASNLSLNEIKNSSLELVLNLKNSKQEHFTIYSNCIYNNFGKFSYRIDFLINTEHIKKAENKLLDLVKSKNDILEIVAHDIRSPISAIQALLAIIQSKNESEETSRLLDMVQKSLEHVMEIAKGILNVAEIDDQDIEMKFETVELNSFLRNIISNFYIQTLQKQIEFVYVPSEEELYFPTNSEKLTIALSNLISNSIKFSFPNSKIKLVLSSENSKPLIQIIDTGIGMNVKTKESLFQKFSKVRSIGTKGEKSTGLGLYITKEIIDKLGGTISIETEQGKGSIFSIRL